MAVKFLKTPKRVNTYEPTAWHLSDDPFPAFRGYGPFHTAVFPFHPNVKNPLKDPTRVLKSKKSGRYILVPSETNRNECVGLITVTSGYDGEIYEFEKNLCQILYRAQSKRYKVDVAHLVVRFLTPSSYLVVRSDPEIVDVFTFDEVSTFKEDEWSVYEPKFAEKV